jgi:hypothetical protein
MCFITIRGIPSALYSHTPGVKDLNIRPILDIWQAKASGVPHECYSVLGEKSPQDLVINGIDPKPSRPERDCDKRQRQRRILALGCKANYFLGIPTGKIILVMHDQVRKGDAA